MAMAMNSVLVLMLGLAMAATSSAAVYKVGDTSGWTILGNVNYTDWAVKKTFHVGDTIEFKYPQGIHNVVEVKKADYDSCTNSSPIATHTSGDDKIAIKAAGHRFFICGVPGHCAAGQKVNIRVLKPQRSSSSDAPSPAPAASKRGAAAAPSPAASSSPPESSSPTTDSSSSSTTTAPAPNASAAGGGGGAKAAFAAVALALVAATAMLQ
ncbi:blue copper protein-like [Oryza glaberrima]|uniref:blue copper protein-like n=1 Tax=Oryza glaberrima TaxID=4538 RepID=UPI00224C22E2|nr:blue copper protein-like [Oryza glaberrima]